MVPSKHLDQGCVFLQKRLMVGVMPWGYAKKIRLGVFRSLDAQLCNAHTVGIE